MKIQFQSNQSVYNRKSNVSFRNLLMSDPKRPSTNNSSDLLDDLSEGLKFAGRSVGNLFGLTSTKEVVRKTNEYIEQANALRRQLEEERRISEQRATENERLIAQLNKNKSVEYQREQARLEKIERRKERLENVKEFFSDVWDSIDYGTYNLRRRLSRFWGSTKEKTADFASNTKYFLKEVGWFIGDKVSVAADFTKEKAVEYTSFLRGLMTILTIKKETLFEQLIQNPEQPQPELQKVLEVINPKVQETVVITDFDREKMIRELEKKFRQGGQHYLPHQPLEPFSVEGFKKIVVLEDFFSYKYELDRLSKEFVKNTAIMDDAAIAFNDLSKNFFRNLGMSLKEIYTTDKVIKGLEMIPKLGIIPKALRYSEQTRLVKCVKQDFDEVTNWYVKDGLIPMVRKYKEQYDEIRAFIEKHSNDDDIRKALSEKYLAKITSTMSKRISACNRLLKSYNNAGESFTKFCKVKNSKETLGLAKKTILTLAPFFL